MITLSNGHQIEFVVSSGALAYGRGWPWERPLIWLGIIRPKEFDAIITKTFTLKPKSGNLSWYRPWSVMRPISGGWVNAIGLKNSGIDWWLEEYYPRLRREFKIIASISCSSVWECKEMCKKLNPLKIVGIEINASCPNVEHPFDYSNLIEICRNASLVSRHPLILKISCLHPTWLVKEASEYVEAVDAINSVPWNLVFPNKKSPLAKYGGGGVSGRVIGRFRLETLKRLTPVLNKPIIAGGGNYTLKDFKINEELGAKAHSLGTRFLPHFFKPNWLVKKWKSRS